MTCCARAPSATSPSSTSTRRGAASTAGLDDRIIGITLEQLKRTPKVVGVSGGPDKLAAIGGALRGGLINVLITDSLTATRLLEEPRWTIVRSGSWPRTWSVRESAAVAQPGRRDPGRPGPRAVRLLLDCTGHVIVSGSGTSHAVALRFAHLLSCCGTPALFLHPGRQPARRSGRGPTGGRLGRPVQGRRDDRGVLPRGHRPEARRERHRHHREARFHPGTARGRGPRDQGPGRRGPLRHDRHGQLALQLGLLRRHLRGAAGAARLLRGDVRRDAPGRRRGPQDRGGPRHRERLPAWSAPCASSSSMCPRPPVPDDGVLLAVRACGICGSDLRRWREGPDPSGTVVPGHEFAGVVAEVGRPGDRLPGR